MLRAILNKSWRKHPTRHQLYGHLPPITKTIQVTRTRRAGHCCRSRDELTSDVLQWTPAYGQAKAGLPARTYIQQLCEDTGCSPEDLPEGMNDSEKWRERVRDIRASGTIWWWWWWWWFVCTLLFSNIVNDLKHSPSSDQSGPERMDYHEILPVPQTPKLDSPVCLGFKILHLCWWVKPSTNVCPRYDIKSSDSKAPSLGNAEYPLIAITSRSTLARSGCKWYVPIYGSNRTVWYLN